MMMEFTAPNSASYGMALNNLKRLHNQKLPGDALYYWCMENTFIMCWYHKMLLFLLKKGQGADRKG